MINDPEVVRPVTLLNASLMQRCKVADNKLLWEAEIWPSMATSANAACMTANMGFNCPKVEANFW